MANRVVQPLRFNRGYWPTQTFGGAANDTVFRGRNVVFKGGPETVYAECFQGNELMEEPQGSSTILPFGAAVTHGSTEVELSAPFVPTHFIPGHLVDIDGRLFTITSIKDNMHFRIAPPFDGPSSTNAEVNIPYLVHSTNQVLVLGMGGGSIQGLQKGHFLVTGVGALNLIRVDPGKYGGGTTSGAFSVGGGFTFPGMLRFEPATLPPTADVVGFTQPAIVSLTAVTGGVKNMPASTYSMRIARGRLANNGFGPLSEAVEVVLNTNNLKMELKFPAAESGQTSWRVFGSLYSVVEGVTGPWYEVTIVPETGPNSVTDATDRTIAFEYRDYEIVGKDLASFDNDPPPRSSFVAYFGGIPVLLGCYGLAPTGTTDDPDNYPYGPVIQPGKANNPEGFPPLAAVVIGQPEPIIGYVEAEGKLYIMTKNALHVGVLSGDVNAPVTVRPFAQSAFARQGNLVYVEGVLYGFTRNGPIRIQTGGDVGIEDRSFAAIIAEDMQFWVAERVVVGYDPASQSVIYFHANDHLDNDNKWNTMALAYHTKLGVWSTPIDIHSQALSPNQDTNVTSCCTLGGRLHFLACNRVWVWNANTDPAASFPVHWWLLTPYIDQGAEMMDKTVEGLQATFYSMADAQVAIFGVESDAAVDLPAATLLNSVAAAAGSKSQLITLEAPPIGTNLIKRSRYVKLNVPRLQLYAVRFGGIFSTAAPTDRLDRVDEIALEVQVHEPKH